MEERQFKCAFTGHREKKLAPDWREASPAGQALKRQIADAVENVYASNIPHFICGMANGCDLYFAEAVLALKAEHPEVTLEAAIPYAGQAEGWPVRLRRRYNAVLAQCDKRTVLQQHYTRDCMMRRNRYMVDSAAVLIAVYNGSPGGTRRTMLYAMRRGLEIIEIEI
jgi:uncharacterized phage-like protein YoqJ